MPEEDSVPIDPNLIKVLASDTRLDILKLLRKRRMTLTELATALNLKKATILEHLQKLGAVTLVKRREDERLWVYYELTPRGNQVVNPGRTRFYLLVGTSALAAVVAVAAFAFLQAQAPMNLTETQQDAGSLQVTLGNDDFAAGGPVSMRAAVAGHDRTLGSTRAYLLTPAAANSLAQGRSDVSGVPLSLAPTSDEGGTVGMESDGASGAPADYYANYDAGDGLKAPPNSTIVTLSSTAGLPPGTYYLYVVDDSGRDNAGSLVEVRVHEIRTTVTPSTWWRGLDGPATIVLDSSLIPPTGILGIFARGAENAGNTSSPLLTATVGDFTARFAPTDLDSLVEGAYELRYRPVGGGWSLLPTPLRVREPVVTLTPPVILEGADSEIEASIHSGDAKRWHTVPVTVDSDSVTPSVFGGNVLRFTVAASGTDDMTVGVGRLHNSTIKILPDVRVSIETPDATAFDVTLTRADGTALAGAGVSLDESPIRATDAAGRVTIPAPAPGDATLRLTLAGGTVVTRGLTYDGTNLAEPVPRPQLDSSVGAPAGSDEVSIRLNNPHGFALTLTATALLDDLPVATRPVELAAGANTLVTLPLPDLSAGVYEVRIEVEALKQFPIKFRGAEVSALKCCYESGAETATVAETSSAVSGRGLLGAPASDSGTDGLAGRVVQLERVGAAKSPASGARAMPAPGAAAVLLAVVAIVVLAGRPRR